MNIRHPLAVLILFGAIMPLPAQSAPDSPEQMQMREAQASLYIGSINGALSMLKSLDLTGANAAEEQDTIRQDATMYEKGIAIYKGEAESARAKREKLRTDIAEYEKRLVPYNALVSNWNSRCDRMFRPEENGARQQCNQEKAQGRPLAERITKEQDELAARAAAQDAEEARLNQQGIELEQIRAKLIARVEDNERKGLDYLAKRTQLLAQIEDFRERLLKLQADFDACLSIVEDRVKWKRPAPEETEHDVCGRAFDGNRVPDSYLPDYSRTPKWSPWGSK